MTVQEKNFKKIIGGEIKEFFQKLGFKIDPKINFISSSTTRAAAKREDELRSSTENVFEIKIKTDEPQILIGRDGETLLEIQNILKKILRKKIKEQIFISVDINEYKEKKLIYLKELAKEIADEVALAKKEKILSPMKSYERRMIHLEISKREDVKSESIGEGPERRVVIKPSSSSI